MSKTYHIGFTGHRPNKLGGYNIEQPAYKALEYDLARFIETMLLTYDTVVCHSGLALGGDTIWSRAILSMREKYGRRVQFHAEIPMMTQASRWPHSADREFWKHQVSVADSSTVYGDLLEIPEADRRRMAGKFLNDRNKGMIDAVDVLLAVYDGSGSGTGNAVKYAKETGVPVNAVHPEIYFG